MRRKFDAVKTNVASVVFTLRVKKPSRGEPVKNGTGSRRRHKKCRELRGAGACLSHFFTSSEREDDTPTAK
jgi:hypothetical protein